MSVKLTWLGHSAFALEIDAHAVVLDPFLSDNPLGAAEPNEIAAEYILLSHGHGDHLGDTVEIANALARASSPILKSVTGWTRRASKMPSA